MKKTASRFISGFLSIILFSTCVFGEKVPSSELKEARERQQKEAASLSVEMLKKNKELVALLFTGGGIVTGGLVFSYILSNVQKKRLTKVYKPTSVDLYDMQSKISANMRRGSFYSAAELGPEGIALLKEEFERWQVGHVYEWRRIYPVSEHKVYQIRKGMEVEFQEEVSKLYKDYLAKIKIDEKLMLRAGEKGLGKYPILWKENFEKIVLQSMRKGGVLKKYVAEANGRSYIAPLLKSAGREGIIGRVGVLSLAKKSAPLLVIGLALGINEAQAQEKEMVRRVYNNPALMLDLSDQEFEKVASSDVLSKFYLDVCDAFSAIVHMTAPERAVLEESLKQNRQTDQQVWQEKFKEEMRVHTY